MTVPLFDLDTPSEEPSFVFPDGQVRIVCDDFLTTDAVPLGSVDLIVTSPPYNVGMAYESYDDNLSYESYLQFSRQWLEKAYQVSKPGGRMCLNVPLDTAKWKAGQGFYCTYVDLVSVARELGWFYFSTIIWHKGHVAKRTAWGSWCSASAPYVVAPVEVIVLLYKERWKKERKGQSDILRDEFIEWTNGLWSFPGETRRLGHPAPFPLDLPYRCIKLFSFVGDTVLDPFMGSGSTLVACARLGRNGIGVEISPEYCLLARNRVVREGKWKK